MNYKKLRQEYTFLLEQLTLNLIQQSIHRDNNINEQKKGVVYVINQVGTSNYKIGISSNYDARLKLFGVTLPFAIKETAVYETDDYVAKEKELHRYFASKRLNNSEFFELTEDDLKVIPEIIYSQPVVAESEVEDINSDLELFEQAKAIISSEGVASTSMLQRRLKIGFSRAGRIMDMLEVEGLVSKSDGARAREVFVLKSDNDNRK